MNRRTETVTSRKHGQRAPDMGTDQFEEIEKALLDLREGTFV